MQSDYFIWLELNYSREFNITLGRKPCLFNGLFFNIKVEKEKVIGLVVEGQDELNLILTEEEINSIDENLIIKDYCFPQDDIFYCLKKLLLVVFMLWLEKGALNNYIPIVINPIRDNYLLSEDNIYRLILYFETLEALEINHLFISIQNFIKRNKTNNFENELTIKSYQYILKNIKEKNYPYIFNYIVEKFNDINHLTFKNFETINNIKQHLINKIDNKNRNIIDLERKIEHLQVSVNMLMRNRKY